MIDTSFLNQLDRFSLVINKRVTSKYTGPRKSIAQGRGIIFKDHRLYARGDDFRSIDWKIFARTDNLYVKTYEEERNLVVHVLVDYSASMNFGKPFSKFDYAAMLGVGFAYLAMKGNEKFQFSTFSDTIDIFQPRRGMSQLASMVHYLNNTKTRGFSKLKNAIVQYRKFIGSRSMIVLISDFLVDIDEIIETLYLLGKHEIKVVQVLDPVEKSLGFTGDYFLQDSETKERLKTYISPRLRMQYQKKLDDHIAKIEETCNKLGINFFLVTTDTPIFDAFYKIINY
jgi:uncharacterized protein (DUF58 family)